MIPSSAVSVSSSPCQFLGVSVSASGLSDPKYGCFTSTPVNPSLVFIVWVASPYVFGASPSSIGATPIIAACAPLEKTYSPTSVAFFVSTTGTLYFPAVTPGPNTPVPRPPVSWSGLVKNLGTILFPSPALRIAWVLYTSLPHDASGILL